MKRKGWGRGKRKEEVVLPCEIQLLERCYALSLLYEHTSDLTCNFEICVLRNVKGDLSDGVFWILPVALRAMEVF